MVLVFYFWEYFVLSGVVSRLTNIEKSALFIYFATPKRLWRHWRLTTSRTIYGSVNKMSETSICVTGSVEISPLRLTYNILHVQKVIQVKFQNGFIIWWTFWIIKIMETSWKGKKHGDSVFLRIIFRMMFWIQITFRSKVKVTIVDNLLEIKGLAIF